MSHALLWAFKDAIKGLAREFNARSDQDQRVVDDLMLLLYRAMEFKHDVQDQLPGEVTSALASLRQVADGAEVDALGFQQVKRLSEGGRYVVFSDHHMAFDGHRQNFFARNVRLYQETLAQYLQNGYGLIENGDVFELVIFEPSTVDVPGLVSGLRSNDPWAHAEAWRRASRPTQFRRIVDTYGSSLLTQIRESFHSAGRYHLLTGNHDQDLHGDACREILDEVYPGIEPYDVVIVPNDQPGRSFVITHGHQFDESSNPTFAGRIGEAFSESMSWAFQGPDRHWEWMDNVKWTVAEGSFVNRLVSAKPNFDAFDWLTEFNRWFVEMILMHPVAWEYFVSASPGEALDDEVYTGKRWFKVRHTDELRVYDSWSSGRGDDFPTLVLGHTHEVRQNALARDDSVAMHYLNSGSAGRFENLIWAVEIEDGRSRLVSWHQSDGPGSGKATRLVYDSEHSRGKLITSGKSSHN